MTDEELKALVAENSLAIREMREESRASRQQWEQYRLEFDRRWEQQRQESDRKWEQYRLESDRRWEEHRLELDQHQRQFDKHWEEILASRRETDRLVTDLNRELGRLGNKLGRYSESLISPSMARALREQFGMTKVHCPFRLVMDGETLQIDLVGHTEDQGDAVYLVEVKSQLHQDDVDQLREHMQRLPHFVPQHRGKKLFGVLAALDVPDDVKTHVLKQGIYVATIKDDVFEIVPPDDFEPRAYGLREAGSS